MYPRIFQQHGAFLHIDTSEIVPRTTVKFNCDTTYSLRAGPTGKQVEKVVTSYHFWKLEVVVRSAPAKDASFQQSKDLIILLSLGLGEKISAWLQQGGRR